MTLASYHLEVKRLLTQALQVRARPGCVANCAWLRRKDVADDMKVGMTPAQSALNWLVGRGVCGPVNEYAAATQKVAVSAAIYGA